MSLFAELKRRNVFRVGIAYAIASWLLLQVSDILVPLLGLQDSVQKIILLLLVIGFVPALIFAWAFELTPEGIKKERDVDRSQSVAPQTGRKLDRTIIVILALAVVFLLYRQMGNEQPGEPVTPSPQISNMPVESSAGLAGDTGLDKASLAVLPFVNMSSDPEQEYFSDGLSEELLNRLAKNDQLQVAARTSAFQFKGQNLDIADIGRQLNVANILEGSVRKAGNRLRITAQLIRVDNGFHLWSETYEREIDDIFAIQDDISLAISKALEAELGLKAASIEDQRPTTNLEAYNLYLQARYLLAQRGAQNMMEADDLFARAVALDPGFTSAWAGKAFNAALLFNYEASIDIAESLSMTLEAARHALALDPDNAEAYTAIGRAQSNNMAWPEARRNYERAYQLDPNDIGVINLYGDFQGFTLGNFDRAISLKQQAISLDPLSGVHHSDLALLFLAKGQFEEALVSARKAVSLSPDSIQRLEVLLYSLVMTGRYEEATALITRFKVSHQNNPMMESKLKEWQAAYYYARGDLENLQEKVSESISLLETDPNKLRGFGNAMIAFFGMRWQDPVEVLPWLKKALLEKDINLKDPVFFYLPERFSDDPAWLDFWNKPELKELLDIRRSHPYPSNGIWLPRIETDVRG